MPESGEPTQERISSLKDMEDALKLAFFGIDLEPCQVTDLPTRPVGDHVWSKCLLRQKHGLDEYRGCSVSVYHFYYEVSTGGTSVKPVETLLIDWHDDENKNFAFRFSELEIGTYDMSAEAKGAYKVIPFKDTEAARSKAKITLGVMTDFYD